MSVCMILDDNSILPKKYDKKGLGVVQLLLESTICLFLIEVSMGLVWSKLELILEFGLHQFVGDTYGGWTSFVINSLITSVASMIFASCAIMTNNFDKILFHLMQIKTTILGFLNSQRSGQPKCYCVPLRCQFASSGNNDEILCNGAEFSPAANSTAVPARNECPTTSTMRDNRAQGDTHQTSTRKRNNSRSNRC